MPVAETGMKTNYAKHTTVSVEKSKTELDSLLGKHGATSRGVMSDDALGRAIVAFMLGRAQFRLVIPLPRLDDFHAPKEKWDTQRKAEWCRKAHEQACRSRWRAVVLLVKAKLHFVDMGLNTAEREFLADMILPNGQHIGGFVRESFPGVLSANVEQAPLLLTEGAEE